MNKQELITSLLNCNLPDKEKLYLINLVNNLKEEERESSAKEKEEVNFETMQEVPQFSVSNMLTSSGNTMVTLTEENIRAGMTGGIGINKMQQEILGLEYLCKGWFQKLIGKQIPGSAYEKFLSLKGATSKC